MTYLFTSESVSEWHPDKIADQISDAILDEYLAQDPDSKVACETLVTTGQVVVAWEVKSKAHVDIEETAREVIKRIWYTKPEYKFDWDSCGILCTLHEQSPDINRWVEREKIEDQWAGDQWMMFGYACNETPDCMPLSLDLAHTILYELAKIRHEWEEMQYLRPDAKAQVTVEYWDDNRPQRIHTIVISTQHDEFILPKDDSEKAQRKAEEEMLDQIREDVLEILMPRVLDRLPEEMRYLFDDDLIFYINPTWKFVIWWPHWDTGLTWRKIIVDTYGGKWAHWWWAFSGKDPSKVDRSAAYAARHIAKNMVAAGICDEALVQIAYAIWISKPISIYVNTYWTSKVKYSDAEIAKSIWKIFDLRPFAIEQRFNLRKPIYLETASYGHMGRTPRTVTKVFESEQLENPIEIEVELFPREKLDYIERLKNEFDL